MKTFGTGQTSGLPLLVTASTFASRQLLHTAVAGTGSPELVLIEVENGPVKVEIATAAKSVTLEVKESLEIPLNGEATVKVWDDANGNKTASVRATVETQSGTAAVSVGGLAVDTIAEQTAAAGVTIDGVLLKDSTVKTDTVVEKTATAGVTLDGTKLKDGGVICADGAGVEADTLVEATANAGVTIETVLVKDGSVTMPDAGNVVTNGTTGTKIGTATTEKLGFWNATPVVQPAGAGQAAAAAATQDTLTDSTGGSASTTLAAITAGAEYAQADATAIKNALASLAAQLVKVKADIAAEKVLTAALRTALVNTGIVKGAA